MGIVLRVTSSDLELPVEAFAEAHAALRRVAQERPSEFRDASAVLGTGDLIAALVAARWRVGRDDQGRVTELRYASDKAPPDSSEAWPAAFLEALAPSVLRGTVSVSSEEETLSRVYEFRDGELYERKSRTSTRGPGRTTRKR